MKFSIRDLLLVTAEWIERTRDYSSPPVMRTMFDGIPDSKE